MTKTLFIFFIIIAFAAAGGAYLIIAFQNNNTSLPSPFAANPSPTTPASMISLTLSPTTPTVVKQQPNIITVVLDKQNSSTTKLKLIQMEIAYDPNALSDIEVIPGDFFVNPIVLLSTINTHSGRISYALSANNEEQTPYTASTAVARLIFTPNPTFQGTETAISFLGKTMIRGTSDTNILTATYGTRLFFATTSAVPQL